MQHSTFRPARSFSRLHHAPVAPQYRQIAPASQHSPTAGSGADAPGLPGSVRHGQLRTQHGARRTAPGDDVKPHGIRRGGFVIEQTEPRRLQGLDIALRGFQAGEMPQGAQALPARLRDGVALDVIVKGYAPPGT